MNDVNKPVREAIVSALDGTITYDGSPVPCYHESNPNETESLYIILNTQTEEDSSNKGAFNTVGTILIDVVHLSGNDVTYDVVDSVASSVMQIMQPTIRTHGLTSPDGLQVVDVRKLSSTPLTLIDNGQNVMRRAMRYEYKIVELPFFEG